MRWEAFAEVLPQAALFHLARTYATVESFLVHVSKALASNTVHGSAQDSGGALEGSSSLDPATLAAVEAVVCDALAPSWRSGLQLTNELQLAIQVLPTGCMAIDTLLGGGLREGAVVEVAGETASGKTQLCLSASATTALRGEAVLYVDTTGSFAPGRVVRMAEAEAAAATAAGSEAPWPQVRGATWRRRRHWGRRWRERSQQRGCTLLNSAVAGDWVLSRCIEDSSFAAHDPAFASRLLDCISVVRTHDVYELLAVLDRLAAGSQQTLPPPPQHQQPHGLSDAVTGGVSTGGGGGGGMCGRDVRAGPRLLVVDSVSAMLSPVLGSNQHNQGYTLLTVVGRMLKQFAARHSTAVLLTNHVTSTVPMARGSGSRGGATAGGGDGGEKPAPWSAATGGVSGLKPALGEQWRPQPHMRLQLSVDDSQPHAEGARIATLTASPLQPCGQKATFHIIASGFA